MSSRADSKVALSRYSWVKAIGMDQVLLGLSDSIYHAVLIMSWVFMSLHLQIVLAGSRRFGI
jgi:hypothetical protein